MNRGFSAKGQTNCDEMNSFQKYLSRYLSENGAKGGKAGTGKAKARTTAQASKSAKARWAKLKEKK